MGRLWGTRSYLSGPMDRVKDNGKQWRQDITQFLIDKGISPIDPCNKPISIGLEKFEDKQRRTHLVDQENYDQLAKEIKLLRTVDLRCVDLADFIICHIDINVHMCGTYEEIFLANRQKKPVIFHVEGGKKYTPGWIFGTFPHTMIFSTWQEVRQYIDEVDDLSKIPLHYKRWFFFDYSKLIPVVKESHSGN